MGFVDRLHGGLIFPRRVEVLAGHLAPLIPQNVRLLDVGSGDGLMAQRIGQLRPDVEVRGIDVLVRAETHIPIEPFDGHSIPFEDDAFGAVMFVDVLHHTEEPMELLREAVRVSGQAVLIKDHLREGVLAGPTLRLMDWVGNARHGVALPNTYWRVARWTEAFSELGMTVRSRTRRLGLYPVPLKWLFERSLHFVARLDVPPR